MTFSWSSLSLLLSLSNCQITLHNTVNIVIRAVIIVSRRFHMFSPQLFRLKERQIHIGRIGSTLGVLLAGESTFVRNGCFTDTTRKCCIVNVAAKLGYVQTDATTPSNSASNGASVCTGLKVWPVSNFAQKRVTTSNNMQQGVQRDAKCNIQQCCIRLQAAFNTSSSLRCNR